MSARLIEFIKRVGEKYKMLGTPSILSLFRNEFYKSSRGKEIKR